MFNRIALAWVWALIILGGLRYPPGFVSRWLIAYQTVLLVAFIVQCVYIIGMTYQQYWHVRSQLPQLRDKGHELELEVLQETRAHAYGD